MNKDSTGFSALPARSSKTTSNKSKRSPQYKCRHTHCDFQTGSSDVFKHHQSCHESNGVFKCALCSYSVDDESDFQNHKQFDHGRSLKKQSENIPEIVAPRDDGVDKSKINNPVAEQASSESVLTNNTLPSPPQSNECPSMIEKSAGKRDALINDESFLNKKNIQDESSNMRDRLHSEEDPALTVDPEFSTGSDIDGSQLGKQDSVEKPGSQSTDVISNDGPLLPTLSEETDMASLFNNSLNLPESAITRSNLERVNHQESSCQEQLNRLVMKINRYQRSIDAIEERKESPSQSFINSGPQIIEELDLESRFVLMDSSLSDSERKGLGRKIEADLKLRTCQLDLLKLKLELMNCQGDKESKENAVKEKEELIKKFEVELDQAQQEIRSREESESQLATADKARSKSEVLDKLRSNQLILKKARAVLEEKLAKIVYLKTTILARMGGD